MNNGTLTLDNCTLTSNQAISGGDLAVSAGAVVNILGTDVTSGSAISTDTSAGTGGGIYNKGKLDIGTDGIISSSITNCTATGTNAAGGGVYNGPRGTVSLSATTISGNTAPIGGGIYNAPKSITGAIASLTVKTSTFQNNTANGGQNAGKGGGIFNGTGASMNVTSCAFGGVLNGNSAWQVGVSTVPQVPLILFEATHSITIAFLGQTQLVLASTYKTTRQPGFPGRVIQTMTIQAVHT